MKILYKDVQIAYTADERIVQKKSHRIALYFNNSGQASALLYEHLRILRQTDFFNESFYREENKDVDYLFVDPCAHYLIIGSDEGRDPSPEFSTRKYLAEHQDVAMSLMNPLIHYLLYGLNEKRVSLNN